MNVESAQASLRLQFTDGHFASGIIMGQVCWSGFPDSSVGKESASNVGDPGDPGLIPGSEDTLEKGLATHSRILGLPLWLSW